MSRALPHFTDQRCFRIHTLRRPVKPPPEIVIHFTRHIQPPAVNMELLQPVPAYPAEIIRHRFPVRCQLRHHAFIPKTLIIRIDLRILRPAHRVFQPVKPVTVLGILPFIHNIPEFIPLPSTMIEHAVYNNTHSVSMARIHQFAEILIPAEARIHMKIIDQIILMIFPRGENRIHIQGVKSQLLQITDIFRNSPQCSAPFPTYCFSMEFLPALLITDKPFP